MEGESFPPRDSRFKTDATISDILLALDKLKFVSWSQDAGVIVPLQQCPFTVFMMDISGLNGCKSPLEDRVSKPPFLNFMIKKLTTVHVVDWAKSKQLSLDTEDSELARQGVCNKRPRSVNEGDSASSDLRPMELNKPDLR